MRQLIIFGPQGSGKGTQAQMLEQELGLAHLNIGERLRHEVQERTPIGKQVKPLMDRGEMVSTEIVQKLVGKLVREAHKGFVLDGFPRTATQAAFLDTVTGIDRAIVLRLSDKAAVARIDGRVGCTNGHDYHTTLKPPKKKGVCDECGLPLKRRADDTKAALMKRLAIYHEQTEPLLAHYKGKLLIVDGDQSIAKVHQDIIKGLRKA